MVGKSKSLVTAMLVLAATAAWTADEPAGSAEEAVAAQAGASGSRIEQVVARAKPFAPAEEFTVSRQDIEPTVTAGRVRIEVARPKLAAPKNEAAE